jgi:hypothetical protein
MAHGTQSANAGRRHPRDLDELKRLWERGPRSEVAKDVAAMTPAQAALTGAVFCRRFGEEEVRLLADLVEDEQPPASAFPAVSP